MMSQLNELEEKKKKEIALFRYGIIAPVLNGSVTVQMAYFREMAAKEHDVPYWGKRVYKVETLRKWLKLYRKDGFDSLLPKARQDKGKPRKIDSQLARDINEVVSQYPYLSGSALYRILVSQGKIRSEGINEGTLRKFIRDQQLREKNPSPPTARKKFEKAHVNELWTADSMHGPYIKLHDNVKKKKVYLIAAIDDHSRMICARGWFLHENSITLESALKEGIYRFGLPKALYCDNGALFTSSHLQLACARLGIALIHSKPYDSPSRGKIERFFRTVRDKFLSILDIGEIKNLQQLNDQFDFWLEKEYHKHHHTGIDETPINRFMREVEKIPIKRINPLDLEQAFYITTYRNVKNDATISVHGVLYECPPILIGKRIQLRYPSDKPQDLTIYQGDEAIFKPKPLNPQENANIPAWGITFSKLEKDQQGQKGEKEKENQKEIKK